MPSILFAAGIVLAVCLIDLEAGGTQEWIRRWPRIFGSDPEGARGMLSTIAASMMTVVGVTFSMTLVTLALAATQFSSRIIRNFMRDRIMQLALGVFAGIFIYCLIVLRTIRGGEGEFVPSLAITFGFVLSMGGIFVLILFIHHIASGIQVSTVIAAVARDTLAVIDRMMPHEHQPLMTAPATSEEPLAGPGWQEITAGKLGYIQGVDIKALIRTAEANGVVLRQLRGVGQFVSEQMPIVAVAANSPANEKLAARIREAFTVHRFRTLDQDPSFGIRQLVDVALRALSPGVNDTTSAVMCVDYLSAILSRLARRRFPERLNFANGDLRVIGCPPSFDALLTEAVCQIRGCARGNAAVLAALADALAAIASCTRDGERRRTLSTHLQCLRELADCVEPTLDRHACQERLDRAAAALQS